MSLSDNQDYVIEDVVEFVHPDGYRSQVSEQKYTGTIRKTTSSPPSSSTVDYLPANFKSVVDRINTGDRVVVILRGLPGSGKSFLAQQIIEATVKNPKDHIISADNFFMKGGLYRYEASKIPQAHNDAQKMFAQKASLGYSPLIVDNTNVEYWNMMYYLQVAVQYHYHVEILEPSTPWSRKDNMLAAKNVHGVPVGTIKIMKDKFESGRSLAELFEFFSLKAVQEPKKRYFPKIVEIPSLTFKPVDSTSFARSSEAKAGPSGFQPIRDSSEVDRKPSEWLSKSPQYWEEVFPVSNQKAPSPDSTNIAYNEHCSTMADNTADDAPSGKSRKNKKTKAGNKPKLVAHRKHCPNENVAFSQIRELYPNVDESSLWDLFVQCQGDANWTATTLMDDGKAEHMSSGKPLFCNCFTDEYRAPTETKRKETNKKPQSPPSSAKKTRQELKKIELQETKAAIEQSIQFAPEHYPEHVNTVKEWKMPQATSVEQAVEPMAMSSSPDADDIGEDFQSLSISEELLFELDDEHGGGLLRTVAGDDFKLPKHFFVKKSVAFQLYIELSQSFFAQHEEQKYLDLRQDAALAKELHEQEQKAAAAQQPATKKNAQELGADFLNELYSNRIDEWDQDDSTEDTIAKKLSKEQLFELFPNCERNVLLEIWKANGYDFKETVASLKDSLFCSLEERAKVDKARKEISNKPWEQKSTKKEESDGYTSEQLRTVDDLREEINDHLEGKKACLLKAQEAIRAKKYEIATYYSNIAQFHKLKGDECGHEVANLMAGIHEKTQSSSTTLDLHYYGALEARIRLDRFLDQHISKLRSIKKPYTDIFIITGRGANSKNGVAIIKPNSKKQLEERKLQAKDLNPGYLGVRIYQTSLLSNELQEKRS